MFNHWPIHYIFAHKKLETIGVVVASELGVCAIILNSAQCQPINHTGDH